MAAWVFEKNYLHIIVMRYLFYWSVVGVSVLGICGGASLISSFTARHPREALRRVGELGARMITPEATARVVLFLELAAFMGAFTTVKTLLPQVHPFWADPPLAALDRAIHFGHDPWRLLHPWIDAPAITQLIEFCYGPIWLAVTSVLPAWMAVGCEDARLRSRFLLTFLLAWIVNGTLLAGLFISGGPVFYGLITGDADRFAPLVAHLGAVGGAFSAATQQQLLWAVHVAASPSVGAGISAFPSLHVSMAGLAALAGWSIGRRVGLLFTAYAGVVLIGSVHLGWHYAIDGYAAIAATAALWWIAGLCRKQGARTASAF